MDNLPTGYVADTSANLPTSTLVIGGKSVDGRTIPARRYRAICGDLVNDLGHAPTNAEWIIIQRVAALTVQAELIEADMVSGAEYDAESHLKIVNTLNRTLGCLKLRTRDGKRAQVVDSWAEALNCINNSDNQ